MSPLLAALWAVPRLIGGLGHERFGLLTLVLLAVGYFSLFDLGMGRALTKIVAERIGSGERSGLLALVRYALVLMWGLGALAAIVVALLAPWLTDSVFNVSGPLRKESLWTFYVLAGTLPFVISSAAFIGLLEAHQRFNSIAAIRIPLGVSNYVGPALLITYSQSLVAITVFLALTRVVAWFAYKRLAGTLEHEGPLDAATRASAEFPPTSTSISRPAIRSLVSLGGWMTVSNIAGPLMVYFDRFLIGTVLDLSAVTFYTTPYEVLTRLWLLPNAMMGVLFPAFAAALAADPGRAARVFRVAGGFLLCVMALPVGLSILFAPELLTLWLGAEFAAQSTLVAQWLALGVYMNCVARLPFIALQGHGRADVTAKVHVVEVVVFAPLLWWLILRFGIVGAAAGWTLRIVVDACVLFVLSGRLVTAIRRESRSMLFLSLTGTGLLAVFAWPNGLNLKLSMAVILILVSLLAAFLLLRFGGRALRTSVGSGVRGA
jgi:O-antigen/teichoic acid export membrane protein